MVSKEAYYSKGQQFKSPPVLFFVSQKGCLRCLVGFHEKQIRRDAAPGTSEKASRQDEKEQKEFECGAKHTEKKEDGSEYKSD